MELLHPAAQVIPPHIMEGLVKDTCPSEQKGGQSCGIISHAIALKHEALGFRISCSIYKSQLRNWDWCFNVFTAYYNDFIKNEKIK